MKEVVIIDGIRTAIGKYGGGLSDVRPDDLLAHTYKTLIERTGLDPALLDDVYAGCGNQAGEDNRDVARMAVLLAGFPPEVPGVTAGDVEPFLRSVGVLTRIGGGELDPDGDDLAVTAGWGHGGKAGATMPGKGRAMQRAYDRAERAAVAQAAKERSVSQKRMLGLLGPDTRDVYLNDKAFWKNVPAGVWDYCIGGYQVIKKWLSYREQPMQ